MVFLLCYALCALPAVAGPDWDFIDTTGLSILKNISNEDFEAAERDINVLEEKVKEIPVHMCYRAALYYKIMEEYQTREFEAKFNENVEKAIKILDGMKLGEKTGDARVLQFLASAYGYRGMYRSLLGQWGSAFLDGRRGYKALLESLEMDNSLVDNYAGIGTYLYWRSRKSSFMKYLLLWGDKRKDGINDLKKAAEKGKLIKLWALGALLRIYIEEEEWDTALKYADELLGCSPADSGALRRKAFALEKKNDRAGSLKIFEKMYQEIQTKRFNTTNAQIDLIYNILRLNDELKNEIDRKPYLLSVNKIKNNRTRSFSDIEEYIEKIEKDQR